LVIKLSSIVYFKKLFKKLKINNVNCLSSFIKLLL
jgi:hypothetical protein